jgi:hypothetical protein
VLGKQLGEIHVRLTIVRHQGRNEITSRIRENLILLGIAEEQTYASTIH